MKPTSADGASVCPFCGFELKGNPNRCPRCRKIVGESAKDIKRLGAAGRRAEHRRKMFADLAFLVGLATGGPLYTLAGDQRLGLFLMLAGAVASALHRYSRASVPGTLLISGLIAAVVAVLVIDFTANAGPTEEQGLEGARGAYLTGLNRSLEPMGGSVEARGPGLVVAWFYVPEEIPGECGTYPTPEGRRHMSDLGFVRIVIANEAAGPGICAFRP